jgi:uncharacterized membrane protein
MNRGGSPIIKNVSAKNVFVRFLIVLTLLGICLRFYNLEHKIFWGDEVFTAMRASGYTATEVVEQTYRGRVFSLAELHRYQSPSTRTLRDTLNALEGSPEHSPLYYLLARFWMQAWGNAPAIDISQAATARAWVLRSLSAIVSLLVFPAIYWLCRELFDASLTGWIAVVIVAVSPFHVLYAQEARGYSLWTVTILLSSAALLRAMRRQTLADWVMYALTVALGLYVFLFSGLVTIAHALYVAALSGNRWRKSIAAYLAAAIGGVLLFSPWINVILTRLPQLRSNVAHLEQTQPALVPLWLLNLSRIFFDFNHGPSWINPLIYLTLLLSVYAIYWICRHTPRRVWLFILTLIGVTGLALMLSDLLLGGQRSGIARYPIPCYLGIQLSVAALFAAHINSNTAIRQRWRQGLIGLCVVGILSCAFSSQTELWWNKGMFKSRYNPEVAELINRSVDTASPDDRPLVVSDSSIERVLSLSYLLKPTVQFLLVEKPDVPRISDGFTPVFLYQPSDSLRGKLERRQNYQFVSHFDGWLWQAKATQTE